MNNSDYNNNLDISRYRNDRLDSGINLDDSLNSPEFEEYKIKQEITDAMLQDFIKKYNEETNKQKEEIEQQKKDKIRIIEILGIFVAIFTFVSIQIQILKEAKTILHLISISMIMFSGVGGFLYLLIQITENWARTKQKISRSFKNFIAIFILIVFIVGVLTAGFGFWYERNFKYINLNEQIQNLKNEINSINKDLDSIENRVKYLKLEKKNLKNIKQNHAK